MELDKPPPSSALPSCIVRSVNYDTESSAEPSYRGRTGGATSHAACTAPSSSRRRSLLNLFFFPLVLTLTLSTLAQNTSASPLWYPASIEPRNIRNLPCVSKKTQETGICMFAFSCYKVNGTHLGTCIDRFYFGSCCQLPESYDLNSIANEVLVHESHPSPLRPHPTRRPTINATITSLLGKPTRPLTTVRPTTGTYTKTTVKPIVTRPTLRPISTKPGQSTGGKPTTVTTNKPTTVSNTTVATAPNKKPPLLGDDQILTTTPNITSSSSTKPTPKPAKTRPTTKPTAKPTAKPVTRPSIRPTVRPTQKPGASPTIKPSSKPTSSAPTKPLTKPTPKPVTRPTAKPTVRPTTTNVTQRPPLKPSPIKPTSRPSQRPTTKPTTTKPVSQQQVSKPTAKPGTPKPTVRPTVPTKPPTPKPIPTKPTATKPTTLKPTTATPTTVKPPTQKPSSAATTRPTTATTQKPTQTVTTPTTPSPSSTIVESSAATTPSSVSTQADTATKGPSTTPETQTQISNEIPPVKPGVTTGVQPPEAVEEDTNVIASGGTTQAQSPGPASTQGTVSPAAPETTLTTEQQPESTFPASTTQGPQTTVTNFTIASSTSTGGDAVSSTTSSDMLTTTGLLPGSDTLNMTNFREVCGRRLVPTSRIVGGAKSSFGKWPWQISLRQWRTSTYLHKCGAALLNENWAITAAHCVENVPPGDLLLRLGEHDLSTESEPLGHIERRVQLVASHPQFDPRTFEYDLALLRFYEPVTPFQANVLPICVPEDDRSFVGSTAFVTGWGRLYEEGPLPSVLQEVRVPVINNSACEGMYRSAGYVEHIPSIFICAGWKKGGFDSCEGDSGGPMVIQRPEDMRWVLAGVISWGIGCAEPNQPGVYTRISEFRGWINQILQF